MASAVRRRAARAPRVWLGVAALVVVARVLLDDPAATRLYTAAVCATAVAAWVGVRRRGQRDPVLRLIAIGITLSAAGDLAWYALSYGETEPEVSLADLGFTGSYVALGAALWRMLPSRTVDRRARFDGLLDGAVVFLVVGLVEWEFLVAEVLGDATTALGVRLVWAAYPLLDALLIALVIAVTVSLRALQPCTALVAVAACLWLASDLAYALVGELGSATAALDAGWLVGSVLLATAAWLPPVAAGAGDARPVNRVRVGVALGALLVPPLVESHGHLDHHDGGSPVPVLVVTCGLLVLVFVRASRLLADQAQLREVIRSRARLSEALAANSSDAVVVLDAEGLLTHDAPQFAALAASPEHGRQGADALGLARTVTGGEARSVFARSLAAPGRVVTSELRGRHEAGRQTWLGIRLVNRLDDPDVGGVVVTVSDVTERRQAQEELAHQAFHDGLTGLPNRALFADRVQQAVQRAARTGLDPTVLYVDLDGFKAVNDTMGHPAGDQLLRTVACRLSEAMRTGDTVARLGGDEFAVLVEPGGPTGDDVAGVAERVLRTIEEPVCVEGTPVRISASIGIATGDADASASDLLRDADIAMYRAKQAGRGQAVVFSAQMRSAVVERVQLESELAGALEAGQLRLVYQPVVAVDDERVVGFEALLRWEHPTLGTVSPDKFVPIAEESGLIEPIGRWVLGEATRTLAEWQRAYPRHPALSMAVNVSGRQISGGGLTDQVLDVLAETGVDPASLVLEITETVLVEEPERAAGHLQELRELGVRLAIDDFGTGYSSLSYLRQFPVDVLKIDRSFVATITEADPDSAIVHGLVELGRTLSLEIIAEGVELGVQRDRLRLERCDLAQGWLFSRPLERAAAGHLLAGHRPPRAVAALASA